MSQSEFPLAGPLLARHIPGGLSKAMLGSAEAPGPAQIPFDVLFVMLEQNPEHQAKQTQRQKHVVVEHRLHSRNETTRTHLWIDLRRAKHFATAARVGRATVSATRCRKRLLDA